MGKHLPNTCDAQGFSQLLGEISIKTVNMILGSAQDSLCLYSQLLVWLKWLSSGLEGLLGSVVRPCVGGNEREWGGETQEKGKGKEQYGCVAKVCELSLPLSNTLLFFVDVKIILICSSVVYFRVFQCTS